MENFKLEAYGLSEMSKLETSRTGGGWWQAVLAAAGAGIYLYNNWDDFVAGFEEGQAANAAIQ